MEAAARSEKSSDIEMEGSPAWLAAAMAAAGDLEEEPNSVPAGDEVQQAGDPGSSWT